MRRPHHSPDEFRAFIAHEVEEIRHELDQLRSRVEAQQSAASTAATITKVHDKRPVIDITTR